MVSLSIPPTHQECFSPARPTPPDKYGSFPKRNLVKKFLPSHFESMSFVTRMSYSMFPVPVTVPTM